MKYPAWLEKYFNWCERHQRWTVVLGISVALLFSIGGDIRDTVEAIPWFSFGRLVYGFIIADRVYVLDLVFTLIGFGLSFVFLSRVLKHRNRSSWWFLITFVPFGWIAFAMLRNRSEVLDIMNGKIVKRPRAEND